MQYNTIQTEYFKRRNEQMDDIEANTADVLLYNQPSYSATLLEGSECVSFYYFDVEERGIPYF